MRSADLLKLIHQNVFGSGHLAPSPEIVCKRLADEFASCDKTEPFVETLGECSRVYIGSAVPASAAACGAPDNSDYNSAVNSDYSGVINSDNSGATTKIAGFEHRPADERLLEIIARLFILTADRFPADYTHADESSRARLDDCINTAREVVRDGRFGFGIDEFDSAVAEFAAAGYPAQSHSDAYRNAYRPAYRVVDSYFARLISCLYEISRLLDEKSGQVRVVIDGRAASGKTTAAELIAGYFSGAYLHEFPDARSFTTEIIHADDFFLPPSLRTPERLNETGGNLHRERFYDEIIANLDSPDGFSYRVFECSKMDYAPEPRKVKPCRLLVFEGAYSLHPDFGDYYDLAIFSDISPDEQRRRILSRNGERMLKRFEQEWIPMEEKYFAGFNIRQKCKITI